MDSASDNRSAAPIRYLLTPRISTDGRVAITLQLYRGDRIALTSPIATVAQREAAEVMHKCKLRFAKLGVEGMPYDALNSTRASAQTGSRNLSTIPPSTRLKFKTK